MITAADIRARMESTAAVEARVITPMIWAAVDALERRTRRLWAYRAAYSQTIRVTDYARRAGYLVLDLFPVLSVTSVSEWYLSEHAADAEAVDADDYELYTDRGRLQRTAGTWRDVVRVVYAGGYTPEAAADYASMVHDVREALIQQVILWYKRSDPDRVAVSSLQSESGSTQFVAHGFHPLFDQAVAAHKREFM